MPRRDLRLSRYLATRLIGSCSRHFLQRSSIASPDSRLSGTRKPLGARASPGQAVLRELVQRVRPVVPVDEIEIRVAGMIRDRAPGFRVLHPVEDRGVAAGGFSEAAAVLASGERPELAVDERNDLAREIVRVIADRGGVHALVAAERREAVR